MTTYTTIANSEIDQESPVTQTLMTALRDNPIAITEGSAGAPQIQTAAIANTAVTLAKLNIATRSFSGTIPGSTSTFISFSDAYAFTPVFSSTSAANMSWSASGFQISSGGSTITYSVSWRYLTA